MQRDSQNNPEFVEGVIWAGKSRLILSCLKLAVSIVSSELRITILAVHFYILKNKLTMLDWNFIYREGVSYGEIVRIICIW